MNQNICGMSIVEDYYTLAKFNVVEVVNNKDKEKKFAEGEGRVNVTVSSKVVGNDAAPPQVDSNTE